VLNRSFKVQRHIIAYVEFRTRYQSYYQVFLLICSKKNRVALVTGSLSGIGLGIAHSLAAKGFNIVLNGFASEEYIKGTEADFAKKYP
jgi:hypothetical protein